MLTTLKIVLCFICILLIVIFNIPSEKVVYAREWTNQDYLTEYANQYGVSSKVLYNVIQCESGWNETAKGDGTKGVYLAFGLAQFHEPTFKRYAKEMGEELDYKNPQHQIKVMAFAFSKGYQSAWTCWTKLYGVK